MEYISHSEADTEALGERVARSLSAGGVVIAPLYGSWVPEDRLCPRPGQRAGVQDAVVSPTFTIVNEFMGSGSCSILICTGSPARGACSISAGRIISAGGRVRRGVERDVPGALTARSSRVTIEKTTRRPEGSTVVVWK
jgi:hypothetical protein